MPVTLEQPVGRRLRAALEIQPRIADDITDISVVRVRPSITLDLPRRVSLTAGYFWSPDFPADNDPSQQTTYEQRVWQQVSYTQLVKKLTVNHQVRLEQRFIDDVNNTSWRFRYMVRGVYPIPRLPKWSLVAMNEIHVNLNDAQGLPNGFNQNRVFAGVRYQPNKRVMTEAGYMLQLVDVEGRTRPNQLNHNIVVRLNLTMPSLGGDKSKPTVVPVRDDDNINPILPY
jgi:hypothetical protein